MSATLYRKHRPSNFKEVVGQNNIKNTLEQEIMSEQVSHAYLFCGPRGVGKTTFARILAKAINCPEKKEGQADPCGKCQYCAEIAKGGSMDIIEIDAASHTGVDNVRENIIASAQISPSSLKYKVFIIDEVHMLSPSAFNALLKTLEEPPAFVVFVLCTTEAHKIPETIISRCQRFDFKKIGIKDIVKKLEYILAEEKIKADREVLEEIARYSGGHMRDAESLLSQIIAISGQEITQKESLLVIPKSNLEEAVNFIDNIIQKDATKAVRLINRLTADGFDLKIFLGNVIELLRSIMIVKINPLLIQKLNLEWGESLDGRIAKISAEADIGRFISCIKEFLEARKELKNSFIAELPVETAIIKLCLIDPGAPLAVFNQPSVKTNVVASNPSSAPEKPAQNASNGPAVISKEEIQEKWNEFLTKIKAHNHSLSFILKVCEPSKINGNELCLCFKYKLHKDRADNPEIKTIIEKVLAEVYKVSIVIKAELDESLEISAGKEIGENNQVENMSGIQSPSETGSKENFPDGPPDSENNEVIDSLLKNFGGRIIE